MRRILNLMNPHITMPFYAAAGLLFLCLFFLRRRHKDAFSFALFWTYLFLVYSGCLFCRKVWKRKRYLKLFTAYKKILAGDVYYIAEAGLNVCMLAPAAFLQRNTERGLSWKQAALEGLFISGVLETLQYYLRRGAVQYEDILHNVLGMVIGCLAARGFEKLIGRLEHEKQGIVP